MDKYSKLCKLSDLFSENPSDDMDRCDYIYEEMDKIDLDNDKLYIVTGSNSEALCHIDHIHYNQRDDRIVITGYDDCGHTSLIHDMESYKSFCYSVNRGNMEIYIARLSDDEDMYYSILKEFSNDVGYTDSRPLAMEIIRLRKELGR